MLTDFLSGFGFSFSNVPGNWAPHYDPGFDFFILIGNFFPAATGIFSGANRSRELKDSQKSIPAGTVAAQLLTSIICL